MTGFEGKSSVIFVITVRSGSRLPRKLIWGIRMGAMHSRIKWGGRSHIEQLRWWERSLACIHHHRGISHLQNLRVLWFREGVHHIRDVENGWVNRSAVNRVHVLGGSGEGRHVSRNRGRRRDHGGCGSSGCWCGKAMNIGESVDTE